MTVGRAYAKINLALVVGPVRDDGHHEVVTVLERVGLCDEVRLERAETTTVEGFAGDTLVRRALELLAAAAGVETGWRVHLEKRIPVAAGLGGGSSDAATALRLANAELAAPLPFDELHRLAAEVGADVPFFLRPGAQLGTGTGADLSPLALPTPYSVVVALPDGAEKQSTAAVYRAFDDRHGAAGFEERRLALQRALAAVRRPQDLAALPPNDLAASPLAAELRRRGAFRADVSGAGPAVYGLFATREAAERAAASLEGASQTWVTSPVEGP